MLRVHGRSLENVSEEDRATGHTGTVPGVEVGRGMAKGVREADQRE